MMASTSLPTEMYFSSYQVESQQGEYRYPQGEVDFTVEDAPVVGLVGYAEELETEGELDEAEYHLHRVEPAAALGQFVEQRGEERQDGERQGESYREGEHRDDGLPEVTARYGVDKDIADDGARAGERDQHEGERHEEDAAETALVGFGVGLVHEFAGHRDVECAEKRSGEYHEYDEEDDIRQPVRSEPVEYVGRHGIAAQPARDNDERSDGKRVEQDDEQSVHSGPEPAACLVFGTFQEEGNGHRHHGEDARGKECGEAPQDGLQYHAPKRTAPGGHSLCGDRRPRSGREVYFEIPILHRRAAHVVAHHPFDVSLEACRGSGKNDLLCDGGGVFVVAYLHAEDFVIYDDGFRQLVCFAFEPCPLRTFECYHRGVRAHGIVRPQVIHMPCVFDSGIEHDFECVVAQVVDPVLPLYVLRMRQRRTHQERHSGQEDGFKEFLHEDGV